VRPVASLMSGAELDLFCVLVPWCNVPAGALPRAKELRQACKAARMYCSTETTAKIVADDNTNSMMMVSAWLYADRVPILFFVACGGSVVTGPNLAFLGARGAQVVGKLRRMGQMVRS
jgi:hypothetical protein